MTSQHDTLPTLDLTEAEIAKLPPALRAKIKAAVGKQGPLPRRWVLVGARTAKQAAIMRKTVKTVGQIAMHRRLALTEKNIEQLVDLYLEGEERAEVDEEIELDNAELRAVYLRQVPCLTSQHIHDRAPRKPKNPSEPASRWKRERRIFAVRHGGIDLYPAFQLVDGAPRPMIRLILGKLPPDLTPWQTAFWFASGNGWLDGAAPQESLADENAVIAAAERMGEIAVG